MRAKSDLTDQSECGLPYSVFVELAVKLVFTEAASRHSWSCHDCCDTHLLGSQLSNRWSVVCYDASLTQGSFYCSENSLQCYNESAEPTAERIVRIRSMQPGARDRLTRATHRAQHPVLRAGAGVSSPSTLFLRPTGGRRSHSVKHLPIRNCPSMRRISHRYRQCEPGRQRLCRQVQTTSMPS